MAIRQDKPPAVGLQVRPGIVLGGRQAQLPSDTPGGQTMHDLGAAPEATIWSQPATARYVRWRLDIRDARIVPHVLVEEQTYELENQLGVALRASQPARSRRLTGHGI